MSKPSDIPQDVWDKAVAHIDEDLGFHPKVIVSRAIIAERERCAKTCDAFDAPVSDSDFVNGQATAAQQIRAAIRKGD